MINPCRCKAWPGRFWCWLDWLTRCRLGCDRHDDWILGMPAYRRAQKRGERLARQMYRDGTLQAPPRKTNP